jgi:hypothetical protein
MHPPLPLHRCIPFLTQRLPRLARAWRDERAMHTSPPSLPHTVVKSARTQLPHSWWPVHLVTGAVLLKERAVSSRECEPPTLSLFVPPYPPSNVVSRPSRRDEAARALPGIYQTASDNASGWCGVLPNSLSVCTGTKATSRHCTEARPGWLIGLSYEYSGVSQSSQAVPSVTHKTSCRCICSPFQHPADSAACLH